MTRGPGGAGHRVDRARWLAPPLQMALSHGGAELPGPGRLDGGRPAG